jgi:hypothetical protein
MDLEYEKSDSTIMSHSPSTPSSSHSFAAPRTRSSAITILSLGLANVVGEKNVLEVLERFPSEKPSGL